MNPSPRQLRMFMLLARTLSFSRTAEELHLTQPTLSKLLRELEDGVGVRLFDRNTRNVKLTRDGQALLHVATRLVLQYDEGLCEFEQIVRHRTNRVAVAALPTLAAALLPELIAQLQRAEPTAQISVHDLVADEALGLLRARRVDMALTGLHTVPPDLSYTPLFDEPFVLLHSPTLLPTTSTWDTERLATMPIISMPHGTGTRQIVEDAFAQAGAVFRPAFNLRDLNTIARFAKAGCGLALLPCSAAELFRIDDLRIAPLTGGPRRSVGIVTRREGEMAPLAARLMRELRILGAQRGTPAIDGPAR